jgi:hypothetical protein
MAWRRDQSAVRFFVSMSDGKAFISDVGILWVERKMRLNNAMTFLSQWTKQLHDELQH